MHEHHVVYEAELKRRWDSEPVVRERWPTWARMRKEPRNLVRLCLHHHFGHHGPNFKIAVSDLPDEALDFAFELLGAYAYDYIRRRYAGDDPRLESRLAAAT